MPLIGSASAAHVLHDTTEIAANYGYIPDQDGNFEGKLRGDAAVSTFFVKGGTLYPEDILLAQATLATGVTEIRVIYSAYRK